MQTRLLHYSARNLERKVPRFVNTLTEASKPALEKPIAITRPFGYDNPTKIGQNGGNITSAFSKDAREQRQRQLDHDIKHSPFYESKSFSNTQGKIFSPPVSYFKKDKAKYFPDFKGYTLINDKRELSEVLKGKVTLLRIFSTISGENCSNTYVEPYLSADGYQTLVEKYPHVQIVDVNLPQSWIKGLFVKWAKSNLKKIIPAARHNLYFILPNTAFSLDVKKTLKCDNMCSGYLYVLDEDGKIRWATSGFANDEESEILWRTVRGLEKELANESAKDN